MGARDYTVLFQLWEEYGGVLVVETSTGPMRVALGTLNRRPKVALRPYRLSPSTSHARPSQRAFVPRR